MGSLLMSPGLHMVPCSPAHTRGPVCSSQPEVSLAAVSVPPTGAERSGLQLAKVWAPSSQGLQPSWSRSSVLKPQPSWSTMQPKARRVPYGCGRYAPQPLAPMEAALGLDIWDSQEWHLGCSSLSQTVEAGRYGPGNRGVGYPPSPPP